MSTPRSGASASSADGPAAEGGGEVGVVEPGQGAGGGEVAAAAPVQPRAPLPPPESAEGVMKSVIEGMLQ